MFSSGLLLGNVRGWSMYGAMFMGGLLLVYVVRSYFVGISIYFEADSAILYILDPTSLQPRLSFYFT